MNTADKYQLIADSILKQLGDDPGQWQEQWHHLGGARNLDGRFYSGMNTLLGLYITDSPYFGTYKALQKKNLQVRKGEKGITVAFWSMLEKKDSEDSFPFLKLFKVFNVDQCDGDKSQFAADSTKVNDDEKIPAIESWMHSQGVPIFTDIGGDNAYYSPGTHQIHLPAFERFISSTAYYATAFHELVHSTGTALKRDSSGVFGSPKYALEELVAESGAAILCQHHGLTPEVRKDHVQYIASWIKACKDDPTAFAKAFAMAAKAVTYLTKDTNEEKNIAA